MVCGLSREALDALVLAALKEDAPYGDLTVEALALEGPASGSLLAKEDLVVCGLPVAGRVFELAGGGCGLAAKVPEGAAVAAGTSIASLDGSLPAVLLAERTALNLLQRMCGIAALTRRAVAAVAGTGVRICDTRKTTPLLRALEKYAVRTGGGTNHRMGLSDAILIKDNHIAAVGSVAEAVGRARRGRSHLWKVEVEVTSVDGFREAVSAGADIVMLDNMSDAQMAEAVSLRPPGLLIEASGGMKLERLPAVAALGVDLISIGALTHSAKASDISLELGRGVP